MKYIKFVVVLFLSVLCGFIGMWFFDASVFGGYSDLFATTMFFIPSIYVLVEISCRK